MDLCYKVGTSIMLGSKIQPTHRIKFKILTQT
jgi:hypothetical protein